MVNWFVANKQDIYRDGFIDIVMSYRLYDIVSSSVSHLLKLYKMKNFSVDTKMRVIDGVFEEI